MHHQVLKAVFLFLVSVVGGFVTASVHMIAIQLSLPPTDLAYGQSLLSIWDDPFVRTIAVPVALFSGILVSPVLYFCLRRRRLSVALPIVFGSVLGTVALLTPFSHLLGWFCGYAALVVSCIICARIP
jgi:hypothetical protein